MSVVTLSSSTKLDISAQSIGPKIEGMHGCAKLSFVHSDGKTRLKDLYQASPLRVLFPTPMPSDIISASLVTTSGGLVGGDRLDVEVCVDQNAAVQVIGQAAEKVYRSNGPDTYFETHLEVGKNAWLEWLPQETIMFDQARLRRRTSINIAPGAMFLGAEFLVFGRTAMGESIHTGLVRDVWEVRKNENLVWMDTLHLSGDIQAQLDHPAGFDGACAAATSVLVCDDASAHLDFVRTILENAPKDVNCAATITNGILVTRWLAFDAHLLRLAFANYWSAMRHELKDLPQAMPRLWHM